MNSGVLKDKQFQICSKSTSWKINCKYQTSDYNSASVLGQGNSATSMLKFTYFLTCASCWKYVGLILKHTHSEYIHLRSFILNWIQQ